MNDLSQGSVQILYSGNVGTIEFQHPQSNAMPGALLSELAASINKLSVDNNIKVIVMKSLGERTFCAGASFDELMEVSNEDEGFKFFSGFGKVINAIRKCPKFVIARVQGKAVGGGVGIAAAADYVLAHESASIKLSELAVGIGPFVVGPAVERKIGLSAFSELTIDATNWRTASWASEVGLYNEVYKSLENLDEGVERLAKTLSQSSPEAMAELKKIFWSNTGHWDDLLNERARISGRLVLEKHTKDFIEAFKNKI